MKTLPQFQSEDRTLQMLQNSWGSILNPVISKPLVNGLLLKDIELGIGNTVINHRLGRKPQGYIIADIDGAATIYRSAAFNDLTLTLNSTAAVTAALWIF